MKRFILAVTGASGMPYALALLQALDRLEGCETHLIVSEAAQQVLDQETEGGLGQLRGLSQEVYREKDIGAPPASGSWQHQGMVVCPCSMASLAAISRGLATTLIHRAADVCLKEKRRLVLVPRETPLSILHLENMLAAAKAGALILPACPGFYHRPQTIEELTGHVAGRVLDHLGLEHSLFPRWGEQGAS